jgi:nitrate reductase NapA
MHPVLFSRVIDRRARGERVTLIDIGTRRTRTTSSPTTTSSSARTATSPSPTASPTCSSSDTYDQGSSSALQLPQATPSPRAHGPGHRRFEDYKKAHRDLHARIRREISGVPASQNPHARRLFADRDLRITSLWCMGMNQHTRGTAINRLVHAIHLLSAGTWPTGRRAAEPHRSALRLRHRARGRHAVRTSSRAAASSPTPSTAGTPRDLEPARRPHQPKPGYHTVEMWGASAHATEQGRRHRHHLGAGHQPRPVAAQLHRALLRRRELADKFLIVSDVYPTATTARPT